jgi:predicted CXXCH cytochrome family protein
MRRRTVLALVLVGPVLLLPAPALALGEACLDCHSKQSPGIVADWKISKHSAAGVDCTVCHGEAHQTATDAAKAAIPTPDTCAGCHDDQVAQFKKGKHALAWAAMKAMPSAHAQPVAMMEGMKGCGGCHKLGLKSEAEHKELQQQGRGFGIASCDAATRATRSRSRRPASPRPARPATWASTTRSGRCTRPRSTGCGRC